MPWNKQHTGFKGQNFTYNLLCRTLLVHKGNKNGEQSALHYIYSIFIRLLTITLQGTLLLFRAQDFTNSSPDKKKAILATVLSGISLNFVLKDYEQIGQQSRTLLPYIQIKCQKYPRIIFSEFKSKSGKVYSKTELLQATLILIIPKTFILSLGMEYCLPTVTDITGGKIKNSYLSSLKTNSSYNTYTQDLKYLSQYL